MKQKLWLLMLSAISTLTAWGAVGDTFTVSYPYGSYNSVTITYIVINEEEKECAIGTGAGVAYSSDVLYNFNIPSEVNGYTVTKINDIAFKNAKTLSTITIPETVKSIGNSAFYGCKANYMRELNIPDNVESIGTYCFGSMDVGKIIIGDGLVEIPEGAFYSCAVRNTGPNLTLGKNIKSIGDKAFYQASGINCILLPDEVVNIGEDAFYNVSATDVVLNSNLETIGQGAFQQIHEKTLTIPDKVQTISQDMFTYSRLEQLTLGKGVNQIMNYPFPESLKELRVKATTPPATTTYAFGSQYDIRTTTKLYVPLGTKSLYENTNGWKEFISIEEIDMPDPEETTPDPDSPAIDFADANVKALCVQYWDINGDGELSEAEAAVVTRLLKVFRDNKKITSFEELQYFTGLTELDYEEFYNCQKLQTIAIPANVTTIGDFAFQDCFSLSSIEIPNGVTTIGNSAFSYCNLSSVTIPASITSLTDNPFYGNSIENYSVSGENGKYDSRNNCNAIIETASNTLIAGCASTIIPSDIKSIGKCAFACVKGLSTVNIPDGVECIADGAFGDCDDLASVTIPGSVTSIGSAFGMSNVNGELWDGQYCSLTSVRIDKETPLPIDKNAFFNRANATLYVPAGTKAAYEAADYWKEFGEIVETTPSPAIAFADANVKALCVANWDTNDDGELSEAEAAAVTDLGEVFKENRDITSFDELEYFTGLTDLGSAFETCTGLRSIVIPVNVVALDAVGNLASLESIRVVEGNTKYDSRNNCNAVIETETNKLVMGCQTTIIPEGITVIGQNAFWGRWGMREINFPASLKTIDESAFAYCISLNNIKLPSGLETIQGGYFGVFANCEGLKEVIVEWAEPLSIPANTFDGCDLENATLYVPAGTKAVYEAADVWKDFGTIVEISGTIFTAEVNGLQMQFRVTDAFKKEVETYGTYETGPAIDNQTVGEVVIPAEVNGYTVVGIGGWSFRNCQKITAVSLPATLTYIGESAFRTCYGLTEVVIPEGVTTIGSRAFYTGKLHKVTLPSTLQEISSDYTFTLSQDDDNIVIVNNPEPIAIPAGAFEWDSMKRSVLIVPLGSREAYQAAYYWKEFGEIVEMGRPGDMNGDGAITMADVAAVIVAILNGEYVDAADADGNGIVDRRDIEAIVDSVLGKTAGH